MHTRKLIAGNWKMNGGLAALAMIDALEEAISDAVDVAICPPFPLIAAAVARAHRVAIGAQDCHEAVSGPHTGSVSAPMLAELGCQYVIVGHSERRAEDHESDYEVRAKASAAVASGLIAIVCVGETLDERLAGEAVPIVTSQLRGSLPEKLDRVVIAYEPVWAIGTGRTPSVEDVTAIHAAIRAAVGPGPRILYGGSVKASNAVELLGIAHVDGALVGGASLSFDDFAPIVRAAAG